MFDILIFQVVSECSTMAECLRACSGEKKGMVRIAQKLQEWGVGFLEERGAHRVVVLGRTERDRVDLLRDVVAAESLMQHVKLDLILQAEFAVKRQVGSVSQPSLERRRGSDAFTPCGLGECCRLQREGRHVRDQLALYVITHMCEERPCPKQPTRASPW